ncbi:MAG TPA: ABC transporter permease [Anaerolineales bacterium]|nr:ABC transporter permease [Anaerolineales bacterium]
MKQKAGNARRQPQPEAAPGRRSSLAGQVLPPLAILALTVLGWAVLADRSGLSSFILPSPADVVRAGWETRSQLMPALRTTMAETAVGLLVSILLGASIAAAIDLSPFLHRALYPLLVASQTVQVLAIAPLLIIWFGFGMTSKVFIVVLICFFPLTLSMADGLASADPDLVALFRAMGARRGQIWRMIRLPAALPAFFSGLKIAVTYSVVGATIAEWVGGTQGLGLYMLRSKNALATDQVFVAILVTSAVSIGLFLLVYGIERLALPWYYTSQRSEQWDETGIF